MIQCTKIWILICTINNASIWAKNIQSGQDMTSKWSLHANLLNMVKNSAGEASAVDLSQTWVYKTCWIDVHAHVSVCRSKYVSYLRSLALYVYVPINYSFWPTTNGDHFRNQPKVGALPKPCIFDSSFWAFLSAHKQSKCLFKELYIKHWPF